MAPIIAIAPAPKNVALKLKYCAIAAPIAAVEAVPKPVKVEYKLHSKLSCFLSKFVLHKPSQVGNDNPLLMPKITWAMNMCIICVACM